MPEKLRLYRFMEAKYALKAIRDQKLKFSDLDEVNDPYESLSIIFNSRDEETMFIDGRKSLVDTTNVLCFSETYKEAGLWGLYADKGKGICLGFDVERDDGPTNKAAKRVRYVKDRIDLSEIGMKFGKSGMSLINSSDPCNPYKLFNLLLTKSCFWKHEREWRICKKREGQPEPVANKYFCPFGNLLELREILIGWHCAEEEKDIESRLNKLVARYPDPPEIFSTRRSLSAFEIRKVSFQ